MYGRMVADTKAVIKTTKSMGSVSTPGQTEEVSKDNGSTENVKVRAR